MKVAAAFGEAVLTPSAGVAHRRKGGVVSAGRGSDNAAHGIAIRAGLIYGALVVLSHPYGLGVRGTAVYEMLGALERSFATLLGIGGYPLQGGVAFRVAVALLGGVLWWSLRRRPTDERTLWELLQVELRFVLAAALIGYGLAKVLHVQMPAPSPADWIRPIREMPALYYVGVWIGSSGLHETMLGLTELVAGLALLLRRTRTLGAVIALLALGNTVMVAVSFGDFRIGSYWMPAELAAMAMLLVLVDLRRLIGFFAFEECATEPIPAGYAWPARWMRRAERLAKPAFVTIVLLANLPTVLRAYAASYRSAIAGVYLVEQFTVNGQAMLPPDDAGARWRLIAIDDCQRFAVRTIDDRQIESSIVLESADPLRRHRECAAATAAPTGTLALAAPNPPLPGLIEPGPPGLLRYSRTGDDTLKLTGNFGDVVIDTQVRRVPDDQFDVTRYPDGSDGY